MVLFVQGVRPLAGKMPISHQGIDSQPSKPVFAAKASHWETTIYPVLKPPILTDLEQKFLKAAETGDIEALQAAMDQGVNVNVGGKFGITALEKAIGHGHKTIIEKLLSVKGIDVNKSNDFGMAALGYAAHQGQTEIFKLLLAQPGIEVNHQSGQGSTPLHIAVEGEFQEAAKLLLAHPGLKINMQNKLKETPLHVAVRKRNKALVDLLLTKPGINLTLMNHRNLTPLEIAQFNGDREIAKKLRSRMRYPVIHWLKNLTKRY